MRDGILKVMPDSGVRHVRARRRDDGTVVDALMADQAAPTRGAGVIEVCETPSARTVSRFPACRVRSPKRLVAAGGAPPCGAIDAGAQIDSRMARTAPGRVLRVSKVESALPGVGVMSDDERYDQHAEWRCRALHTRPTVEPGGSAVGADLPPQRAPAADGRFGGCAMRWHVHRVQRLVAGMRRSRGAGRGHGRGRASDRLRGSWGA